MSAMVLVTGGAGFIGRHLTGALLAAGHATRVLDSLERPPHVDDLPHGLDPRAEFLRGDVRDPGVLARALDGVGTVCHLAARGGYTHSLSEYLDANSVGTARLLETLRERRLPVTRMLVASSVAIYGEGTARCAEHGRVHPGLRTSERLARGQFEPVCPRGGCEVTPVATLETDSPAPERPYSISKYDQERLVLSIAPELGIDAAALRYFVTYGPGQSLNNPYTGVLSLFAARTARGQRPLVYEDGLQTRDFIHVTDLVAAHLVLLGEPALGGRVLNVGTGLPTTVAELARRVAQGLGRDSEPELPGRFRLGDVRHIHADVSALEALGWRARIGLEEGVADYLDWFRSQSLPPDRFEAAEQGLRGHGLIREVSRS